MHAVFIDIDQWIAKNLINLRTKSQAGLQQVLDCPVSFIRADHTFHDGDWHGQGL